MASAQVVSGSGSDPARPAVLGSGPGAPEVLKPGTSPVPTPGEGEVLVKVAFAGINRPDCLQRAGGYPPPPGASDIPGLEISGTVVAVGSGVSRWTLGDAVCALVAGGQARGAARRVAAREARPRGPLRRRLSGQAPPLPPLPPVLTGRVSSLLPY